MVLGRLVHYAVDAVLLSTVVAGVRRSSGFSSVASSLLASYTPRRYAFSLHQISTNFIYFRRPNASGISDPTVRSVAESFLGVGETVFDVIQATAVNSPYFKKDRPGSR